MSAKRRFLHDDEARVLQVAHDTFGGDCGLRTPPQMDHVPAGVSLSDIPPRRIQKNVTRTNGGVSLIGGSRISLRWLFVLPAFLLGASLERGSGSAQSPCPVGAPAEVHHAPGEDLERIDVALTARPPTKSTWRLTC
jgi:hypothetical protein